MSLQPCPRCATPLAAHALSCSHCGTAAAPSEEIRPGAMLLLGLTMAGPACIGINADYGVADTDWEDTDDVDGDGYTEADGDCDDTDPDIHPGAEETAGDGVDSNCDGEDDP